MPLPAVFAHLFSFRRCYLHRSHRLVFPVAARSGLTIFFLCVCRLFCQVRFIFTGLFFSVVFIFRDAHNFFTCVTVRPVYPSVPFALGTAPRAIMFASWCPGAPRGALEYDGRAGARPPTPLPS